MKYYDNAVSPSVFKQIQTIIFSENFPWYHIDTAYHGELNSNPSLKDYSFSHLVMQNGTEYNAGLNQLLTTVFLTCMDNANETVNNLFRIRIGLIMGSESNYINKPHVDSLEPHKTALLYLNTTNGSTVLYKEKYDVTSGLSSLQYFNDKLETMVTVEEQSPCIENRLICFDGLQYHSSMSPTDVPKRIAINFNYT